MRIPIFSIIYYENPLKNINGSFPQLSTIIFFELECEYLYYCARLLNFFSSSPLFSYRFFFVRHLFLLSEATSSYAAFNFIK